VNSASRGNSNSSKEKRRVTTTNDASVANVKAEVVVLDGSIRINATDTAQDSGVKQPPYKSIGLDDTINVEDNKSNIPSSEFKFEAECHTTCQRNRLIIQQKIDNFEEEECHEASKPKVDKARQKQKDFFDHVDELKAYKEEHGHLKLKVKEDKSLYNFCRHMREARRAINSGKVTERKLTEDRIAALDAIGFTWNPQGLNMPSTLSCSVMSKSTLQATIPKINIGDVGSNFVRSLTLDGIMERSSKFFLMLLVDGIVGASMKMVIVRIHAW